MITTNKKSSTKENVKDLISQKFKCDDSIENNPDDEATNITQPLKRMKMHRALLNQPIQPEESTFSQEMTPTCSKNFQPRVDQIFKRQKSFQEGGAICNDITNRLLFMISKDKMPYNTVEKEGFRTFIQCVAPLYKIPDRKKVTTLMEEKYDVLSNIIKKELSSVNSISLTTDIWTDTLNNVSYLGMTCHYVHDYKFKSVVIGVLQLFDHHTSSNIQKWLLQMVEKWEINKDSVIAVVSDNAANIKKAVSDSFGEEKQLFCLAHTLNLIPAKLFDSDETISSIHKKVKAIVTYFKKSVTAADALRSVSKLMLIQSVDTRWNSSHDMYERFITLSKEIAPILLNSTSAPEMLTATELQVLKEVVFLLQPFKAATTIVSGEFYTTGSQAIPVIKNLKISIESQEICTDSGRRIKKILSEGFDKRFKNMESLSLIAMSTILDPRFKRLYFSDKVACSVAINKISKLINKANTDNFNALKENLNNDCSNKENVESTSNSSDSRNFWSLHDALVKQNIKDRISNSQQNTNEMPEEFRYYLDQPVVNKEQCPLQFWSRSPNSALSKLAIRYLTVIATSVPSERLFSQAALILTDKRNRLSADHFQQLLFLTSLSLEDWHLN